MSRSAPERRRQEIQLGRKASAGREMEFGTSPRVSSRLSSIKNDISDGVVTAAVAPTSHLVVAKGVSNTTTLGAGELVIVQWDQ